MQSPDNNHHNWTKEELEECEYARMNEMDKIARILFIEESVSKKFAKNAILAGLQDDIIVQIIGLTLEQVQALRNATK